LESPQFQLIYGSEGISDGKMNASSQILVGTPETAARRGLRVKMSSGYKTKGLGTVVDMPDSGVCSVRWDSGLTEVRLGV
jgi:hypothetical protein